MLRVGAYSPSRESQDGSQPFMGSDRLGRLLRRWQTDLAWPAAPMPTVGGIFQRPGRYLRLGRPDVTATWDFSTGWILFATAIGMRPSACGSSHAVDGVAGGSYDGGS